MAIFPCSWRIWLGAVLCILAVGCETLDHQAGGAPRGPTPIGASTNNSAGNTDILRTGDKLTVEISDIPTPPAPVVQAIRDDGTITLPLDQTVIAAGKTRRQLTDEIHDLYVPKYYRRMTVIIRQDERWYYVGGDVKQPGRMAYSGDITVMKAIQSAGDFNDFGDRKNVLIIRVDGHKQEVNVLKARTDPTKDVPIYPGDQIFVRRRVF